MRQISLALAFAFFSHFVKAQYTTLHSFGGGADGYFPYGSLISDGTFLYGTTSEGGIDTMGTIFKVKPDGTGYSKLHDFNGANGKNPQGTLFFDGTFLYGMTLFGGTKDSGVIFKIMPDGTGFTKIHDFSFGDGTNPSGSLISDGTYLYGMTGGGGLFNDGTIFRIKPDGTGYTNLLDFDGTNGASALGSLYFDGTFLYGMTYFGGAASCWQCGVIFKIKPDGSSYSKLLDFNGMDGKSPKGSLISDGTFLYGMTQGGGVNGYGNVFKIKPDGTGYAGLHDFNTTDGRDPTGDLLYDGTFLYGMTSYGGITSNGVIFKIKPDGSGFSKLLDFNGTNQGSWPTGSLISDGNFLYGMTNNYGANNGGTVFKFHPPGMSVAENTVRANFKIQPNPFSSETTLQADNVLVNAILTIENSYGQVVKQMSDLSGQIVTIERDNLPSGLYFVNLIQEGQNFVVKKIIITDN